MEVEMTILKNKLKSTEQKLELADMEFQANETIVAQMNETIEILKWCAEVQGAMFSQFKDITDKLLEKVDSVQNPLIGKKDIMNFFDKESDFALRFLRMMRSMGHD